MIFDGNAAYGCRARVYKKFYFKENKNWDFLSLKVRLTREMKSAQSCTERMKETTEHILILKFDSNIKLCIYLV